MASLELKSCRNTPLVGDSTEIRVEEWCDVEEIEKGGDSEVIEKEEEDEEEDKEKQISHASRILRELSCADTTGSLRRFRTNMFIRDLQISMFVAFAVVLFSFPFIVYPWSKWINASAYNCYKIKSPRICANQPHASCAWAFVDEECRPTYPDPNLALWGASILQFVFSVSSSVGATIKLTVHGFTGTFMAWLNVTVMNYLFGGGAYTRSIGTGSAANSPWLPLCSNTGTNRISDNDGFCFLNIKWNAVSAWGTFQLCMVWLDFILFVAAFLSIGKYSRMRMFALSTHVFFMMSFVNPTDFGFEGYGSSHYSIATRYMLWNGLACLLAILVFFCMPRSYVKSLESAEEMVDTLFEMAEKVVSGIHSSTDYSARQKLKSKVNAMEEHLKMFERYIDVAKYEMFKFSRCSRRRKLQNLAKCVRVIQGCEESETRDHASDLPCVQAIGELTAPTPDDTSFCRDSLEDACKSGAEILTLAKRNASTKFETHTVWKECLDSRAASIQLAWGGLSKETKKKATLEARALVSTTLKWLKMIAEKIPLLLTEETSVDNRYLKSVIFGSGRDTFWYHTVPQFFGLGVIDSASHPRFVLRNTISICLAFLIGWKGLWNVLPPYSTGSANTIAVIVYFHIGAHTQATMKRISGVVLGRVTGTILLLLFGVQSWALSLLYAVAMWLVICYNFFYYLHWRNDEDKAYVACLTAAYTAQGMIPSSNVFREAETSTLNKTGLSIFKIVAEMVIGVVIMIAVDSFFHAGQRASTKAKECGKQALEHTKCLLEAIFQGPTRGTSQKMECDKAFTVLEQDLDALAQQIPYADSEPRLWRQAFNRQLYENLERHLRKIGTCARGLNFGLVDTEEFTKCASLIEENLGSICEFVVSLQEDETFKDVLGEMKKNLYTCLIADKIQGCCCPGTQVSNDDQCKSRREYHTTKHKLLESCHDRLQSEKDLVFHCASTDSVAEPHCEESKDEARVLLKCILKEIENIQVELLKHEDETAATQTR